MIDWGLFALVLVVLSFIFLAFHAWRGIKADADRIIGLVPQIQEATKLANEALALAREIQGTHYKALLRRIDESEASTLGHTKQVEVLAAKMASLGGRLSALQRWTKDQVPEADQAPEQSEMFQAAPVPPPGNAHVTGHFGRPPGRKVG